MWAHTGELHRLLMPLTCKQAVLGKTRLNTLILYIVLIYTASTFSEQVTS